MATTQTHTNNFGTDATFGQIMAALNPAARQAFDAWLVDHEEVQGAAATLRPEYFDTWVDNNAERLVRAFERSAR